jgi:hypothetical protein
MENGEDAADGPAEVGTTCSAVLVGLQSVLLSLARAQAVLGRGTSEDEAEFNQLFNNLRREWSANLATQLTAT